MPAGLFPRWSYQHLRRNLQSLMQPTNHHWRQRPMPAQHFIDPTRNHSLRPIIFLPQLILKSITRIELPLQCEKLTGTRVSAEELCLSSVELIGKVVGASNSQCRVDEFASPAADFVFRCFIRSCR